MAGETAPTNYDNHLIYLPEYTFTDTLGGGTMLKNGRHISKLEVMSGDVTLSVDGYTYFSKNGGTAKITCDSCFVKLDSNLIRK